MQSDVGHLPGSLGVEMGGLVDDHHGPGKVDLTLVQHLPDPGVTFPQVPGQVELRIGGTTGQTERSPDLRSGQILPQLHITTRPRSCRIRH